MSLAVCSDGVSSHTGSACSPPVLGTISAGSNSFFTINGVPVVVEDGTLEVPSHLPASCIPPPETHSYPFTSVANSYFYIEGLRVVTIGDGYLADPTTATGAGANTFFDVET